MLISQLSAGCFGRIGTSGRSRVVDRLHKLSSVSCNFGNKLCSLPRRMQLKLGA
ncbi:hypothetical protein LINPERHAP1_LOCUS19444 [Linum perenne]